MLKLVLTAWLGIPTPSLTGAGSTVTFLQSHLAFYTTLALTVGIIIAAVRLMLEYRSESVRESAYAIVRTLVVIAAGSTAISLATVGGDHFSTWIVGVAANGATPTSVLTSAANLGVASSIAPGIIIILGALAVLGMLIQIAMLLCRSAFLVILAGVWPFAAAVSTTEDGKGWYRRLTGWIVAFILFKPTAAIIYAAAIKMIVVNQGSELSIVEGVVLVVMAAMALPALMRLIVPMTARMGGISGGEVGAAAIGVAAGAIMIASTGGAGAAGAGAAGGAGADGVGLAGGALGGGGPAGGSAMGDVSSGSPEPGGSPSGGDRDPVTGPPAGDRTPGQGDAQRGATTSLGVGAGGMGLADGTPSGATAPGPEQSAKGHADTTSTTSPSQEPPPGPSPNGIDPTGAAQASLPLGGLARLAGAPKHVPKKTIGGDTGRDL
jgi:hypothetical protein